MTIYLSNRDGNGKTSEEGHYKFQTSVFYGNILGSGSFVVSQNSPTGMSVKVSSGQYKIDTLNNYSYTGWSTTDEVVSIATADSANPRISTIVLYVDKSASTSPSPPNNPGITKLVSVNGVPSAIPSAPNASAIQSTVGVNNPYTVLANVYVGAAATQITDNNIVDTRQLVSLSDSIVGQNSLADNSVTTTKIANLQVTEQKIATGAVTTGKIANGAVTDLKWKNGIAFFSRRTAARSLPAQTWSILACNTIDFDYGGNYSATGRFTAPVKGVYSFSASLFGETPTNTRAILDFRKNGTEARVFDATGSAFSNINGTKIFELNAGDYVEAWCWLQAATNIANATGRTSFSGHLITRT